MKIIQSKLNILVTRLIQKRKGFFFDIFAFKFSYLLNYALNHIEEFMLKHVVSSF